MGLPQLDGIAATRQIKEACPHIKVLMLTSHQDRTKDKSDRENYGGEEKFKRY